MKISQCMIVKNEAHNLEKSLGYLKDAVDEQIVVDTGSTDNTVEVAKALGAKVYHFEWISDFAAAKNYAIEQASGDWILFLDADEYIEKEKAFMLKDIIEKAKAAKAAVVRMEMFHIDATGKVFMKGVQDRLFLNRKDIRYVGAIHERIATKRSNFAFIQVYDPPIWHTGYMKEEVKSKDKGNRNIQIIREEIEKDPTNAQMYNYLADAQVINDMNDEGLDSYRAAYEMTRIVTRSNRVAYLHSVHGMLKLLNIKKDFEEAEKLYFEVIRNIDDDADVYFYMGQIYQSWGKFDEAINCYETCVELSIKDKGNVFNATLAKLFELNMILFSMYINKKEWHNAVKKAVLLISYDKYHAGITSQFITVLKTSESNEAIFEFLKKFYDYYNYKDRIYLYKILSLQDDKTMATWMYEYLTEEEKQEYGNQVS